MGVRLVVERSGGDAAAQLRSFASGLVSAESTRPLMESWGRLMVSGMRWCIDVSQHYDGGAYQPLAGITVYKRLKRNPAHPHPDHPLFDTERMHSTMAFEVLSGTAVKAGPTARAEKDGFPYPIAQNKGFTMPNGARVPARRFIGIPATTWADIERELVNWFSAGVAFRG
jgi:hypothetical protein